MSRRAKIFCFVALVMLALHAASLLDMHSDQDECAFGPVSNQRYRELLAEAEKYQRQNWPFVIWSGDTLQQLLNAQFQTMTNETRSPYEKIAAMHAILRGIGADFLYVQPSTDRPFAYVSERGGWVSFGYQINVNRLALFYPFGRTGWLIGSLAGPKRSRSLTDFDRKHPQGDLHLVAHYPNPIDPIPDIHRGNEACPAVPSNDLAPSFLQAGNAPSSSQ
jgi:hypothetical protein